MTGSRGLSQAAAAPTVTIFGASIAGMPSLTGPPERISLSWTQCLAKLVPNSKLVPGGGVSCGRRVHPGPTTAPTFTAPAGVWLGVAVGWWAETAMAPAAAISATAVSSHLVLDRRNAPIDGARTRGAGNASGSMAGPHRRWPGGSKLLAG